MAITITDYCNVRERAVELGLNTPEGLAIIPRNFETAPGADALFHESSATTLRSLFRQHNIQETRIESAGRRIPCIQENEFALTLPILFVGFLILTENPDALSVALGVISNYATDFFKGIPGDKKVALDIVVEDDGRRRSKKIHYEGSAEGLKELKNIVGKAFQDDH